MGASSRTSGGLYNSVRQLGQHLLKIPDTEVQVFAYLDANSYQDNFAYQSLPLKVYRIRGPKNFGYSPDLYQHLEEFRPDIIHTQCIWMYLSYASYRYSRRHKCPIIISPRGMLDAWALQNAAFKKKIVLQLFERKNLNSATCIHALCQSEAEAIRAFGLKNPIVVIPNGVNGSNTDKKKMPPNWYKQLGENNNPKVLLFLSRIHPKKGLDNLLEAWHEIQNKSSEEKKWILAIAGWGEESYLKKLKAYILEHNMEQSVFFIGSQLGLEKAATFHWADAFILPSFSEGLPMAVLEAWSYSLPVLLTPACNLPTGFSKNAAVQIESTSEGIYQGLKHFFSLSPEATIQMGKNGKLLVQEHFLWPHITEKLRRVYKKVLQESFSRNQSI